MDYDSVDYKLDGYSYGGEYGSEYTAGPVSVPLAHMDFLPRCVDHGGVFSDKQFERFDILIDRANEWIRRHNHLRIKCAESIELKKRSGDHGEIDTEKVTFYEYGEMRNRFIRALRIWVVSKDPDSGSQPSQIGYYNIVPVCTDEGGFFSNPKFESFGQTLDRLNQQLRSQPLPGKVINVETQDMKFHSWGEGVDPDETYWTEAGKHGTYFLNVIRIFYELGLPACEEVGCADFVPSMTQEGGFLSNAHFQSFGSVVAQARGWICQQHSVRVVNVQSIDYKLKSSWSGNSLDTHRTMFYERGEGYTYYLRILRVCYTRTFASVDGGHIYKQIRQPLLNYKTFVPAQLTKHAAFTTPQYESMSETIRRATAWLNATGVKIISAETVPVRLFSGNQHGDPEQTYTWNHGDRNETWLFVVRVYLENDFREPPAECLPPLPEILDEGCDWCCALQ